MRKLREWILRISGLFNKKGKDRELDQELESHLQLHFDDNLRLGMRPEAAKREAMIKLGGIESTKEAYRDQRGLPMLETLWQDIRYGTRQLRKNPGFTAVGVLTLALGIGANTAMFSFVNAILIRPLPYKDADRLVMLFQNQVSNGLFKVSIDASMLEEWRKQTTVFEGLGAVRTFGDFTLTGRGQPEVFSGSAYSANVFPLLGIQPQHGRGFLPDEEIDGHHHVVLLSYELWQRRFGGDMNILGQSLTLGREPYTVIGVMPPRTIGPEGKRDLWTPLAFKPYELNERHKHDFSVYAKLKRGATLQQARVEMDLIARRAAEADPQYRGWGAEMYPLREIIVSNSRRLLLVLLGSVGLVLVIGCANIASLLLARSAGRMREFAIRVALGAGRGALIRQLLTESCVLALVGGALGIFLARLGLNGLVRFSPPDLPRVSEGIPLDGTTVVFAGLVTLGAGILFGLIPALQSCNPALARELAEATRGGSLGQHRQFARAMLVVGEVALSLVLLIGAALTIRSFERLLSQKLGFVPEHLVTMLVSLPGQEYPSQTERSRIFDPLLAAVRAIPSVDSASYAFGAPLTSINSERSVAIRGAPSPALGEFLSAGYAQVSPGYFMTMRTPLLQGRDFTERDQTNTAPVVIVDEMFAKKFKLGDRALGQRIDIGDGTQDAEIVGVVEDVKRTGLADRSRGEMYRPYRQICWGVLTLLVRTRGDPTAVTHAIRAELDRLDKNLPLQDVSTMTQLVSANVAQRRLSVHLLSAFAGAALLLAALGLYGVLGCTVNQRTREIGIRMALGAQRSHVLGLVIGQGMRLALAGVALGLVGAFALTRVLQRLLFEIKPTDPLTFTVVSMVLILVALIACWLPARRAAKVDPMVALRYE